MTYGIIFWDNLAYSVNIFRIQKKIIRIMGNLRVRDSCRNVFKTMKTLPFYSHYMFSVLLYIINNRYLSITSLINFNFGFQIFPLFVPEMSTSLVIWLQTATVF
jgi:hypothetical protein